jgi:methionine sulfoxide reductase catalytic subunit
MPHLGRRKFLGWVFGAVGLVAAACGVPVRTNNTPEPSATQGGTATSAGTIQPKRATVLLQNENKPASKPTWNVRYALPFQSVDHETWRLEISGLVEKPQNLSLVDIQSLASVTQVTRMACVEGWSCKAEWVGFTYQTLAELVQPKPEAKWLFYQCADKYWEYLSIEELQKPHVLFAYKMDGVLLPDPFGAPLRMIVPYKYGYKGAKAITAITFQDKGGKGYWSTVSLYSTEGSVQSGTDYPVDLGGRREIKGGEITEY